MYFLHLLAYFVIATVSLIYLILRKRFSYWADRGIEHDKPVLVYGNLADFGKTKSMQSIFQEYYQRHKDNSVLGGFYLSFRPAVVLFDLDLIKNVLIKDFNNFSNRGQYHNEIDDPLSGHLFNLDGSKWRNLRSKLTPTFTSGKMKFMFPTVVQVAEKFMQVLEEQSMKANIKQEGVEMKDLSSRFTTDVIGCVAFGLECNTLRDPKAKFLEMGKKSFAERRHGRIVFTLMQAFPNVARKLGIRAIPEDIHQFFMKVVAETVEYREREGIKRNDFMNLLLELKQKDEQQALSFNEIAAQAFVFFLAGFETSSSTMSFVLYELALNVDIQQKARSEVMEMLRRYKGEWTYEGLHELKYLQQVLYETMRKYSIATILIRKTINDYAIPNTKHIIEAGTMVIVPIDAIHHDPQIYPNPHIFDPERFTPSELEKRHAMSWLPFGEGPRNCIGLRFGEMQAMIGLAMLLRQFHFKASKETQIPLEIDVKSFVLASKGGIVLNVEKIISQKEA